MGRPGAMLVQSQPTHDGITDSDLKSWYLDKHIPEVLDTGGVRGVLFCQLDRESSKEYLGEQVPKLYLAVYLLHDLAWLHEEGCGLWRLPLVLSSNNVDLEARHRGRSVFEVAEFVTHFWEVVEAAAHNGMVAQPMAGPPDDDKTKEEPTMRLVLSYLDSPDKSRTNLADLMPAPAHDQEPEAIISTLFKVDETNPGPPASKNEKGDTPVPLPEQKYLHCHQLFGNTLHESPLPPHGFRLSTVEYTVLAEFGDTKPLRSGNETSVQA
ncbi:uncharacterized protein B0H64DRAFT_201443 [Chaetomium fimeti]|uniref:Uncharacterized protein n=1 Tax=Chaetomium fimeti TaxID=1854472 RepID=A0AAE0LRY4_9PEZI|nr:hypothetical protein B0H64DRAFT_201443 [Chaetomium fimeti]